MVAHQDARHGPATPRDRNRPREASSVVTADKTRHSPQHAASRKRGNGRLSLHYEIVPTCGASFPSIVLGEQRDQQRCRTRAPAQDSISQVLILTSSCGGRRRTVQLSRV